MSDKTVNHVSVIKFFSHGGLVFIEMASRRILSIIDNYSVLKFIGKCCQTSCSIRIKCRVLCLVEETNVKRQNFLALTVRVLQVHRFSWRVNETVPVTFDPEVGKRSPFVANGDKLGGSEKKNIY